MDSDKVKQFMTLAGQKVATQLSSPDKKIRALGAQLLLSEVLEYVVHGLNVVPKVSGIAITEPNQLEYEAQGEEVDQVQMLDGLADTAYTMYWNALAFGLPLEEGFDLVCDNNLEKFVRLDSWKNGERFLDKEEWHCNREITWPNEVASVQVINVSGTHFAVGKDKSGKVRKPSSYKSVDLAPLLNAA